MGALEYEVDFYALLKLEKRRAELPKVFERWF